MGIFGFLKPQKPSKRTFEKTSKNFGSTKVTSTKQKSKVQSGTSTKNSINKEYQVAPKTSTASVAKETRPFQVPTCEGISYLDFARSIKRVDLQKPASDVEVFCAVKRVRVCCYSKILDKMSPLTKFIIRSISEGKTFSEINELTQIGARAVEDEITYLKKGKILDDSSVLQLTPLGRDHSRLIYLFDRLSSGIEAQLNLYTDQVENTSQLYQRKEFPEDAYVLEGKYSKLLLQNPNYSNSLDFVRPFLEEGTPFLAEIAESLYTTIRLERNAPTLYQRLILCHLSCYEANDNPTDKSIEFCLPVQEIQYQLRIYALDPVRAVLDTLDELEIFDKQLLSDNSLLLVQRYREEQSAPMYRIYADLYNGEIVDCGEDLSTAVPEGVFLLKPTYPYIRFALETEGLSLGKYLYLEEIKRHDRYLCYTVPYSRLSSEP